jgi:dihydroorotase
MYPNLSLQPFEGHVHFRDAGSPLFKTVVHHTTRQCWGAVVMPNTKPFVTSPELADSYAAAIKAEALKTRSGEDFVPIMTGYLTADIDPGTVVRGFQRQSWRAMKFYPKGATTNSHGGMPTPMEAARTLEVMEGMGMPLLIHPEVNIWNGKEMDPYDREDIFLEEVLPEVRKTFPRLKISLEHITTRAAVRFMEENGKEGQLVCTVTAHHLLTSRIDFFRGGPNPHLHCWPIPKREEDRQALLGFIAKGHSFVSAGSDSAPHPTTDKERACGCAGGVFTAHAMVELYAEGFEEAGALEHLNSFLGKNGPIFYGLKPRETDDLGLEKSLWTWKEMITTEDKTLLRPFGYHENESERRPMKWRLHNFNKF